MDKDCKETFCAESCTDIVGGLIKLPLGKYSVKVCGKGVHSVTRIKGSVFSPDININVIESNPLMPNPSAMTDRNRESYGKLQKVLEWFHYYFSDLEMLQKLFPKPFEICTPTATDLQKEVWTALQNRVAFGCTVSYGELAAFVNRPKAARAIGTAMKNNPNCIIVPCHRVIKATSEIGNYNGGADIKIWLLNYEKEMRSKVNELPAKSG